jgi:3-oxoadipate enol-lactonase
MTEVTTRDGVVLNVQVEGPDDGPPLVLAGSLGTSLGVWDLIIPFLPKGLRVVRYDMRGHGASQVPDAPYSMGQLISDAEAVCDALAIKDAMFVGLSVGGMVGQGLAVKRPDLIRALVLSNTATKIGTLQAWKERIAEVEAGGLSAIADKVMHRWFGKHFYGSPAMPKWLGMLMETPIQGYLGVSAAIAGTDFYASTSGLRIPTLGIAGSEDGATPPDMVREMVDLIPGSQLIVMWKTGHLPCVENPKKFAEHLTDFIKNTGHI